MSAEYPGPNSDKARAMATFFVHGPPGIRGDWNKSARAGGYSRPPRTDNQTVNRLIEEVRAGVVEDASTELEQLFVDGLSWEELAERARPILAKIAAGKLYATAQQVAALKELLARGEGRAGSRPVEAQPVAVVVLPVLGQGKESQICPVCLNRLLEDAKAES